MMDNFNKEYTICENEIFNRYSESKSNIEAGEEVLCSYIGKFDNNILSSTISQVERSLIQKKEPTALRKKVLYLLIETFQNIIFHSDGFPDGSKLSYILVTKRNTSYYINACNTIKNNSSSKLSEKINDLLNKSEDQLTQYFDERLKMYAIKGEGYGGMGLVSMLSKTEKNTIYTIDKLTANFSLFEITLKIK